LTSKAVSGQKCETLSEPVLWEKEEEEEKNQLILRKTKSGRQSTIGVYL
jgi:hypothetical protein